ncbi:hypothetical protein AB0M35_25890 [Micromonospora sp. NPDC051196]|uniref:hypothetical protein n=1 Tax=Micromonospora sp. NPDC051196 TaxID=3155281 RepID=UPI00341E200E
MLDLAGFLGGEQVGPQLRCAFASGAVEAVGAVDEQRGGLLSGDGEVGDDQGVVRSVVMA